MTATQTVERARLLYENQIRSKVDPANNGKYIVIDVNSADYAVGDDYLALSKAVRARHPEAELAILRIGHRTVGRIGARVRPA